MRASVPLIEDPDYIPALESLCEQHGVGVVLPLTDLDIEVLARARADGRLPALVPRPEVARRRRQVRDPPAAGSRLPSPPTVLAEDDLTRSTTP